MRGICFFLILALVPAILSQPADELGPCDPLVPIRCMLPFPNNFFTQADASTATGLRLRISDQTFPLSDKGEPILANEWNQLDGFSPLPAILSYFPDLSLVGVPPHANLELSVLPESPTIILDTVTMLPVAHWGELDETTQFTNERAFMLWPALRLVGGRRYIVAMRNLLSTSTGLPITPSDAFLSLRDNTTSTDPSVYLRKNHFDVSIFPLLNQVGFSRETLQLAWDFTVGSTTSITGRLLFMRDDGLSRIPSNGPEYWVTDVIDAPSTPSNIIRQIKGEFSAPYYTDRPGPGCHLVIGSDGNPVFQGFTNVTFSVNIPNSLVNNGTAGLILQYGHGLFGTQGEIDSGALTAIAETFGYVFTATNWWGMDSFDVPFVTDMLLTNITNCGIIPDRSQQGFLNFLILTRLMTGAFATDPNVIFNGKSVIDPNRIGYNGNSQGGIYGCTFMSVSQDIIRGVLGVPGGPYALMLPRSVDFDPYFTIIKARYANSIDRICLLSIIQLLWDRADPSGYFSFTTQNTLPNTPPKQIAIQYSLGDSQVSWLSALAMGRSMGAYMFPDNVEEDNEILYGFPVSSEEVTTAVIQGFEYGAPSVPQTNTPPGEEFDTHSCARKDPRAQKQMDVLFNTGLINDYCEGPCSEPTDPPVSGTQCQQGQPQLNHAHLWKDDQFITNLATTIASFNTKTEEKEVLAQLQSISKAVRTN